ncbi:hypothetical protein PDE_03600 [Penicillium oxalicum 114-2]|uniref:Uncharacterized protein n=1 Tax=Penicillium oxalicum (strain 114-2 / CGMCC 5302) TaxID=933388 RepID=S7ZEE1_PENO1|nr:hypothetical protein PDE_03600 [Penicillium oxalicum 114-2]
MGVGAGRLAQKVQKPSISPWVLIGHRESGSSQSVHRPVKVQSRQVCQSVQRRMSQGQGWRDAGAVLVGSGGSKRDLPAVQGEPRKERVQSPRCARWINERLGVWITGATRRGGSGRPDRKKKEDELEEVLSKREERERVSLGEKWQ